MKAPTLARIPRATYRVQLTPDFGFAALLAQLDYLAALGISDLYLSPIFAAAPGSTHGYDVSDYTQINEELGGAVGFDVLCAAAADRGLGLVLDFVPNHMGTEGGRNQWWNDVLQFGRNSRYAGFFDIQWQRHAAGDRERILLPILESHFGQVVEAGKIRLVDNAGRLELAYGETRLPVNADGYARLLAKIPLEALAPDAAELVMSPPLGGNPLREEASPGTAKAALDALPHRVNHDAAFAAAWRKAMADLNQAPFTELTALLEAQHYRLTRWKAGIHEINYRRFFAISTLVGLRMEDPAVFAATHATLGELLRRRVITGLRIDHVDGLRDPAQYLQRLQALAQQTRGEPVYLLVEKILNGGEQLPESWPVHGTTGYEFIPQLAGVFVRPAAEAAFSETYATTTGDHSTFPATTVARKEQIMRELFPDVVGMLGWQLADLLAEDVRWRDFSRNEITVALQRLVAHLGVYRTYRTAGSAGSSADHQVIAAAARAAIASNPRVDPEPLEFLAQLLQGDYPPPTASADYRARVLAWVLTWQQYTGAIMAKSVEDTAFYTYNRWVGLNEVGGDPAQFGLPVAAFHATNERRAAERPHAMLATSTHDTKLSEDVRARLYATTEFESEWAGWTEAWEAATRPHVTVLNEGPAPDARDRYRFYQILLGVWPLEPAGVDETFRARLREHLRKAVGEAKRHTSEVRPNQAYFAACDRFVDQVTSPDSGQAFLATFLPAAAQIASVGARVALAQAVIKLTVPGVPDIYQGCETWDFSLVDPDNRRAVDFSLRRHLQREATRMQPAALMSNWGSGAIKSFVIQTLLARRRKNPALFSHGAYHALEAEAAPGVVAYKRSLEADSLVVVLPGHYRTKPQLSGAPGPRMSLPPHSSGYTDLFSGGGFPGGTSIALAELFSVLPCAVLSATP